MFILFYFRVQNINADYTLNSVGSIETDTADLNFKFQRNILRP